MTTQNRFPTRENYPAIEMMLANALAFSERISGGSDQGESERRQAPKRSRRKNLPAQLTAVRAHDTVSGSYKSG